ncbi:hypothetical protein [Puniceicoccus vermicola]|uniref:CBM-cenC domain-containing protein n=2 Tax=Puniceicoccus vermicola TaxID=388746 RepID=A0A7X1AZC1_9BACT|nr:hypothetical protein [Puniceicoccus vermicola]MBC2602756.1 hypothetical protein [Puniceicoccus vermicola]
MNMKKTVLVVCVFWFGLAACYGAENLLENGSLTEGSPEKIPGWIFSTSSGISEESKVAIAEGKVTWARAEEGEKRFLEIQMPEPSDAHVWWLQKVKVLGGLSYQLSLEASASGDRMPRGEAGVFFTTADGKWLGYQPIPNFYVTGDWKRFSMTFTPPDNAAIAGVRLGLDNPGGEVLRIRFGDVVLTEK